jgi:hypothetical protein
MKKEYK